MENNEKVERAHIAFTAQELADVERYSAAARVNRSEAIRRLVKAGLGQDVGPEHPVALQRAERLKSMEEELPLPSPPPALRRSHAQRIAEERTNRGERTPD